MLDDAQSAVLDSLDDFEERTGFGDKCGKCGAALACSALATLFIVIAAANSGSVAPAVIFGILGGLCFLVALGIVGGSFYQSKAEPRPGAAQPAPYPVQPGRYPSPYPMQPAPYPVPYPPPPPPVYPQYYPAYGPVRYV